ncbi:MAG: hypothetical protein SGI73_10620 [Chloroflexota bacterium]|nr:hypothetical protein [Chloroflexota bacterium]
MFDLYDQIVSQRGSFEQLMARIPGFRGYLDKATRRTADRIIRDAIADGLAQRIQRLTQLEKRLLNDGGMKYMSETASAKTKLQTYRDRVAAAMPGYSGFDSAIKVDEAQLELLYNFDAAQIQYVDRVDAALNTLENAITSKDGIDAAISALDTVTIEASAAYALREQVLTNLDQELMK